MVRRRERERRESTEVTKAKRTPQDLRHGALVEGRWVADTRESTLTSLWKLVHEVLLQ